MQDSLGKYLRVFIVPALGSVVMSATVIAVRQGLSNSLPPLGLIVAATLVRAIACSMAIRFLAPELFEKIIEVAQIMMNRSKKTRSGKA